MTPLRSARFFRLLVCLALGALLGLPAARAQFVDGNNTGGGTPTPYGTFNAPGYTPPAQGALSPRLPSQSGAASGRYGLDTNASPNPFGGQQDSGALQRPATGAPGNAIPGYDASLRRANLPPPRPSEFQKFVEIATGRMLPLFGARFFAEAADNFAPVDNVPVSGDYTVGPGDEVRIRAWGAIDVDYRTVVDRNGMLNLPKVGSFNVAGVKAADLEKNLRAQIGRLYTNFDLSVSLGQLRGVKVFVVGPAQRPGVYTLSSQSTMLSAVVAAGGPGPNGSMRKVLLRRDGRVVSELDIYEFLVQGDKSRDVQLAAGDVVVFQPAGARVALVGALDTPAIYELKTPQEPVREVLRYAGGTPTLANPNRAQLERVDATQPKAARFVEEFKLDGNGLQKTLRDGDVLTLLAISPQFANAVTLKGHVAQPLRYPYKPGMRIRDLIPDRDALISPDFYRRKNLLVQVMDDDADGVDGLRRLRARLERESRTTGAETVRGARRASDDADIDRADRARRGAGVTAPDGTVPDREADRMNRMRSRDEAYDARTDSRDDDRFASAERPRRTPTPLFDDLNWDYAVIERLNTADLTTQVIPFNLGRAVLQGDEASNVELMPGDVVTIYSQKDIRVPVARQTRLVSLEGEVGSPGVYQLLPGETLRSLIARAGGFTPQAYVYGLEFSREETRQRQRENLAAAITRLQSLSAVQSAREAANRRDDQSAAAASAVSNAATQAQLARLSQLQPNGRIALELSPATARVEDLPDVPLENADRIVVPPRPGFITVAGAVVNNNAFVWKPGRTAGEYLRLAGADEAADPSNMFILRADGTVTHAGDRRGFFNRGNLESEPMQPGDALIVPNQLDFETWGRAFVRNLKDFSQIFSGFGIGIAAIHSIQSN